jgi:hypothetical protein
MVVITPRPWHQWWDPLAVMLFFSNDLREKTLKELVCCSCIATIGYIGGIGSI